MGLLYTEIIIITFRSLNLTFQVDLDLLQPDTVPFQETLMQPRLRDAIMVQRTEVYPKRQICTTTSCVVNYDLVAAGLDCWLHSTLQPRTSSPIRFAISFDLQGSRFTQSQSTLPVVIISIVVFQICFCPACYERAYIVPTTCSRHHQLTTLSLSGAYARCRTQRGSKQLMILLVRI